MAGLDGRRYSHEPDGYACPLCEIVAGRDSTDGWTTQEEVIFRDTKVVAWINPRWWPNNHSLDTQTTGSTRDMVRRNDSRSGIGSVSPNVYDRSWRRLPVSRS